MNSFVKSNICMKNKNTRKSVPTHLSWTWNYWTIKNTCLVYGDVTLNFFFKRMRFKFLDQRDSWTLYTMGKCTNINISLECVSLYVLILLLWNSWLLFEYHCLLGMLFCFLLNVYIDLHTKLFLLLLVSTFLTVV